MRGIDKYYQQEVKRGFFEAIAIAAGRESVTVQEIVTALQYQDSGGGTTPPPVDPTDPATPTGHCCCCSTHGTCTPNGGGGTTSPPTDLNFQTSAMTTVQTDPAEPQHNTTASTSTSTLAATTLERHTSKDTQVSNGGSRQTDIATQWDTTVSGEAVDINTAWSTNATTSLPSSSSNVQTSKATSHNTSLGVRSTNWNTNWVTNLPDTSSQRTTAWSTEKTVSTPVQTQRQTANPSAGESTSWDTILNYRNTTYSSVVREWQTTWMADDQRSTVWTTGAIPKNRSTTYSDSRGNFQKITYWIEPEHATSKMTTDPSAARQKSRMTQLIKGGLRQTAFTVQTTYVAGAYKNTFWNTGVEGKVIETFEQQTDVGVAGGNRMTTRGTGGTTNLGNRSTSSQTAWNTAVVGGGGNRVTTWSTDKNTQQAGVDGSRSTQQATTRPTDVAVGGATELTWFYTDVELTASINTDFDTELLTDSDQVNTEYETEWETDHRLVTHNKE